MIEKPETFENQRAENPIDVSLVAHALTLSPEDRIEAHESARRLAEDLRKAGQNYYASRPESLTDNTPPA